MNAANWLYWSTGVLVFVFLAAGLLIEHAASHSYALLALLGLATFFVRRERPFSRAEKTLFILVIAFVAVSLLSWLINDRTYWGWKQVGRHARLLMAIPVIYLLIRARLTQGWFWYGVAAGAIFAGCFALITAWQIHNPVYRIEGATDPVHFGNFSLIMGFMSLAGYGFFRERGRWQSLIPVLAFVLGLIASVLSESRSGWTALPAILLLFFWFFWGRLLRWQRYALLALAIVAFVLLFAIPQTGVQRRIDAAVAEVDACIDQEECATAVGMRLLMWGIAWDVFLDRPILGGGAKEFKIVMENRIKTGGVYAGVQGYSDPHNEYLSVLASRGIIGFITLIALLFGLGWIFLQAARSPDSAVARVGLAGLTLIVTALFMGFTIPLFEQHRSLNVYSFFFAILIYLVSSLSAGCSSDE